MEPTLAPSPDDTPTEDPLPSTRRRFAVLVITVLVVAGSGVSWWLHEGREIRSRIEECSAGSDDDELWDDCVRSERSGWAFLVPVDTSYPWRIQRWADLSDRCFEEEQERLARLHPEVPGMSAAELEQLIQTRQAASASTQGVYQCMQEGEAVWGF